MGETTYAVSEEMNVTAKVMVGTMQIGLERKRRILDLRETVRQLEHDLAVTKSQLAVEEAEQRDEAKLIRDMWETWKTDLAERRADA